MKIGIVTIPDLNNYGNRLQNYAVTQILKKHGHECQTIRVSLEKNTLFKQFKKSVRRLWFYFSPFTYYKVVGRGSRYTSFEWFTSKNIPEKVLYSETGLIPSEVGSNYDCFVVGSDQVWNPTFTSISTYLGNYLLTFTEKKKISYAASFGVSELAFEYKDVFKEEIKKFDVISVREETGAAIIKELIEKDVDVLIDPTLMLSKEEWINVSKKTKLTQNTKPYILKYFLGEQSQTRRDKIADIAIKNNLHIYELLDFKEPLLYMSGPGEFIDLVNNATLICTDSFHAVVFAIIFGKPFLSMEREEHAVENMNSRVTTLLKKLDLERKLPNNIKDEDIFECDYKKAYKNLQKEKEKTIYFLENTFKDI